MSQVSKKRTLHIAFPTGTTPHLHIILTNPDTDNPCKAAMVNISTCRGFKFEDSTVILKPGDHPFIQHASYVAYDYAKKFSVDVVQGMIDKGSASFREDISDKLFEKIVEGLYTSKRTPIEIKKYCRKNSE